jgi:GntR family transcriptional regulator of arabinose operon
LKKIILNKQKGYPLYRQLADLLLKQINAGDYQANEILPSEVDFAKMLKINHLTIRKALKVLEADGYVYKIRGKGSFVSEIRDNFIAKKEVAESIIVGVSMPEVLENHHMVKIARTIADYLDRKHINTLRMSYIDPVDKCRHIEHNYKIMSGIILQADTLIKNYEEFIRDLKSKDIHVVMVGNLDPGVNLPIDHIQSDDQRGAANAVDYFVSNHYRDIIFATHERYKNRKFHRRLGYEKAMYNRKLEKKIITIGKEDYQYGTNFDCRKIMELITSLDQPLAIIAENDIIAKNIYLELKKHKIEIPGKVELLGFGNDLWEKAGNDKKLPISTIAVDRKGMALKAAEIMYGRIKEDDSPAKHIVLPTKLLHRKTTRGE